MPSGQVFLLHPEARLKYFLFHSIKTKTDRCLIQKPLTFSITVFIVTSGMVIISSANLIAFNFSTLHCCATAHSCQIIFVPEGNVSPHLWNPDYKEIISKWKKNILQMPNNIPVRLATCVPHTRKWMQCKYQLPDCIITSKPWLWRCTPSPTSLLSIPAYATLQESQICLQTAGELDWVRVAALTA